MVDCATVFGARRRRTFTDRMEAEKFATEMRVERAQLRSIRAHERRNHHVTLSNLTDTQRAEIIQAYELLGNSRGLLDAVRFYCEHSGPANDEAMLETVFDSYMESKRKSGKRPRTIRDAEGKLRSFVYDHRYRPAHTITTADIEAFLDGRGYAGSTRDAYRRAFLAMFNWAIKRGYTGRNPAMAIERTTGDQGLPSILSVKETKRLLATAQKKHPEMIPYFAIGIFAGLRPENELSGLDWKNVDLADRLIRVEPATAKKRRQRFVEISANLAAWLAPHLHTDGTIYYSRRYFREIREGANINWDRDIMRHTFASYHLAKHKGAAATAIQLGHSGNTDVLYNHYRNLVKPKDADEFWCIKPQNQKVIKLPQSA